MTRERSRRPDEKPKLGREIGESGSEKNSLPTVIYIVCRGHSGSTMLELLLNRNTHIAAMGELDLLPLQIYRDHRTRWVGLCSCLKRPVDCPIWGPVIDAIQLHYGIDLTSQPFRKRLGNSGLEEEYGLRRPYAWLMHQFHSFTRLYMEGWPLKDTYTGWVQCRDFIATNVAHLQGVRAVVDASKDPLQATDLVQYSALPVKLLYLTRDVRGLVWSAAKSGRASAAREARVWTGLNLRILNLLSRISGGDWLQVKYEDLCSNTEQELLRIFEFIGIPYSALGSEEEQDKRHTIAGNSVRFRPLEQISEDRQWSEHLSKSQLADIAKVAAGLAKRLGYDLNSD